MENDLTGKARKHPSLALRQPASFRPDLKPKLQRPMLASSFLSLYMGAMLRLTDIKLPLDHPPEALKAAILKKLRLPADALIDWRIFKRAHDARNKHAISYIYTVDVTLKDESQAPKDVRPTPDLDYKFVAHAPPNFQRPLVIGAGPCGLFAALILAQSGFRPIILERGKDVRSRTKDTWGLWRRSVLNPESNVQFGEGGAGTFSDGKLYSQIKDPRHLGRKVLTEFVKAGAPEEILTEAHPHIGTFR
ncbi:MAG TPA: FAD-dependent monooxygenase, partial [Rhizomicrobium sp.]|nr:FAD-dependent monooxygenase [Rhizomicrobium sp.]